MADISIDQDVTNRLMKADSQLADDIAEQVRAVDAYVEQMKSNWRGDALEAFVNAKDEWVRKVKEWLTALENTRLALGQAQTNLGDASRDQSDQIRQMLHRLDGGT